MNKTLKGQDSASVLVSKFSKAISNLCVFNSNQFTYRRYVLIVQLFFRAIYFVRLLECWILFSCDLKWLLENLIISSQG